MSNDLTRWMRDEQGDGGRVERYGALPLTSRHGAIDRTHERRHVVRVHDLERESQEGIAKVARDGLMALAAQEQDFRATDNAAYLIHRSWCTVQLLAADKPELHAELDILHVEFFQRRRRDLNRPSQS